VQALNSVSMCIPEDGITAGYLSPNSSMTQQCVVHSRGTVLEKPLISKLENDEKL
jgi:hypothetical protein